MNGRRGALLGWLLWVLHVTGVPRAFAEEPVLSSSDERQSPEPDVEAASHPSFGEILQRALEHFRARQFAEARSGFDRAVELAPPDADVATLKFNAAVSAYELGDFADAEQRFLDLADFAMKSASAHEFAALAKIHAGFAALKRGDLNRAREQLNESAHVATQTEDLRRELRERLAEARQAEQERKFRALFEQGIAAFRRKAWRESERRLLGALGLEEYATERELGSLHYLLSALALERGELTLARRRAEQSIGYDDRDAYLYANHADVALAQRDFAVAERSYTKALRLGLRAKEAQRVERDLATLYPVPRAGAHGWVLSGGGYDSNASQSGVANALAASNAAVQEQSGFLSVSGFAGYTFRAARQVAWEPFYAVDWLALLDEAVRDLSLQAHEAGLNLDWAPAYHVNLGLTASASLLLTGLEQTEPFSFEGLLGVDLEVTASPRWKTFAKIEGRAIAGFEGQDYLSGMHASALVGEQLNFARGLVRAEGGFRYHGIGTQRLPLNPAVLSACGIFCINADYEIPLGYLGPFAGAEVRYSPLALLTISFATRFELRRYLADSFIRRPLAVFPVLNRKTRQDLRYRLSPRAQVRLDDAGYFSLVASYSVLFSSSNIAFQPADAEHFLDYDDRNFVQHAAELSLQAQF